MIDFDKLKISLDKIESKRSNPQIPKPIDPTRGLKGELLRKMIAGLAGHRSGNLTKEESAEIEKIQSDFDFKQREHGKTLSEGKPMNNQNLKYKWRCLWRRNKFDDESEETEGELDTVYFDSRMSQFKCSAQSKASFKTPRAAALAGRKHEIEHGGRTIEKFTIVERYIKGQWNQRCMGKSQDLLDYDEANGVNVNIEKTLKKK